MPPKITILELPNAPSAEQAILQARLLHSVTEFCEKANLGKDLIVKVAESEQSSKKGTFASVPHPASDENFVSEFLPRNPLMTFERLAFAAEVKERMINAVEIVRAETALFEDWGLNEIVNAARSNLLLEGPAGTGKTAAADAIASYLGRQIVSTSYADLESKFIGEGPKRIANFFRTLRENGAVGLIDEADTLLGSRMQVTSGSERAANAMTNQLLIELEQHRGIMIFATNFMKNTDSAFRTRVVRVHIPLPDPATRERIWAKLCPSKYPGKALDFKALAEIEGLSGRDIRNAYINAAGKCHLAGHKFVTTEHLKEAAIEQLDENVHDELSNAKTLMHSITNIAESTKGKLTESD